jgi:hypothetical protein
LARTTRTVGQILSVVPGQAGTQFLLIRRPWCTFTAALAARRRYLSTTLAAVPASITPRLRIAIATTLAAARLRGLSGLTLDVRDQAMPRRQRLAQLPAFRP